MLRYLVLVFIFIIMVAFYITSPRYNHAISTQPLPSKELIGDSIDFNLSYRALDQKIDDIHSILQTDQQQQFIKPGSNDLSFGWVGKPFWVKLKLESLPPHLLDKNIFLELAYPPLDHVDIYLLDENQEVIKKYTIGDNYPFSQRPLFDRYYIIPIDLNKVHVKSIYFYVNTSSAIQIPLRFLSLEEYIEDKAYSLFSYGVFYGFLISMLLYNFFIYLSVKRISYLYYVLFVISFSILQLGIKGIGFQFIWQDNGYLNNYAIATGGSFSVLFLTLFARAFLHLKDTPRLLKLNNHMLGIAVLFILLSITLPYQYVIKSLAVITILFTIRDVHEITSEI